MLLLNTLHVLSPFRGLVLLMRLSRGFSPPAVFFRTSGAYLADSNSEELGVWLEVRMSRTRYFCKHFSKTQARRRLVSCFVALDTGKQKKWAVFKSPLIIKQLERGILKGNAKEVQTLRYASVKLAYFCDKFGRLGHQTQRGGEVDTTWSVSRCNVECRKTLHAGRLPSTRFSRF